jgi:CHASE2 domain-containing sensor protein/tRNA A-37 threonylcarbamoyl transferase component Bud32
MAEEPTSTIANNPVPTAKSQSSKSTKGNLTASVQRTRQMVLLSHCLSVASTVMAAVLTVAGSGGVQWLELQATSAFFQMRGAITPPEDVVILAIDDQSVSLPEQYYKTEPQQYSYLEVLKSFPYKRAAYAQIIDKLMQAGARAVALDIVFDTPSSYGEADDRLFQAALTKYGSKVTLAAVYENFETHQGKFVQLTQPQQMFRTGSVSMGSVNFLLEVDGKIHRLAREFPKSLAQENSLANKIPAFEEAVLSAAKVKYPPPKGDSIHFWGANGSFPTVPLWYVLDPENWNNYLQQGKFFHNKIVLIGATAKLSNDFHPVPITQNWLDPERMAGVEIHANAIASLMHNKAIAPAISSPILRGLFVLTLVGTMTFIITRNKQGLNRLILSLICALVWGGISYAGFIYGQLVFPTIIPMTAIAFCGLSYFGTDVAKEKIKKQQMFLIFQKYKTSPVVQEIVSQYDDLDDLIQARDLALKGKILGGRYQIVKVLGAGGFSETYIAEDTQRPGNPQCVVKQLKSVQNAQDSLALTKKLFYGEAKTLERLGTHPQIPYLLASFEEGEEFYLVQEYIVGHPLNQELIGGRPVLENSVVEIIRELLKILTFVHNNEVIHRDIKPNNIIRRHSDWKLVLIDFGAVKEVTTQVLDGTEQSAFTIGIGTRGYAPVEQCLGRPRYNSDIYAVGMIAIKALTGVSPHELVREKNDQVKWLDKATVSPALAEVINRMVAEDHKDRYQSTSEVLEALDFLGIPESGGHDAPLDDDEVDTSIHFDDDADDSTTPWV